MWWYRTSLCHWLLAGLILTVVGTGLPSYGGEKSAAPKGDRTVQVRVDPRVELVSIIFRLAGNPEYGQGRVKSYVKDVEKHFDPVRSHEAIEWAAGLRKKYGVSYDACMSMAVHMKADGGWGLRFPMQSHPVGLDGRWRERPAEVFIERVGEFVNDSEFDRFLGEHRPLYDLTEQRMRKLLEEEAHLEWFDEFFGDRPSAQFTVIPGLVNGGACYGPRVIGPDGREEYYCILGVWKTDWRGRPTFDATVVGTIIHEFCHSYTNAIVDKHAEAFREAGEAIFPHVEESMRRQAYGSWKTMIYESLVRASVIRYVARFNGRAAELREIGRQNQRGFVWVEELSELLAEYEENRDQYPTLDAFAPRIVAFFEDYAKEFEAEQEALEAKRPEVVSMTPASGDERVDPAVTEIRVEFDGPMRDGSWSMCGGGENFPETVGQPSYDEACKVWTVHVRLKAEHEYRFSLNSKWFRGFRSAEGGVLEPVEVRFTTGPSKETR